MAFQGLGMKTDSHKNMEMPGLSSFLSSSYLAKLNFQNRQFHSSTLAHPVRTGNQLTKGVDIINFVPSFSSHHSLQMSDLSKTIKEVNIKKIDSYSQFASMNVSHLVGGFVGSKSQLGFTSMQGDRFQIWDIVWQKLIEIMGSNKPPDFDINKQNRDHENVHSSSSKFEEKTVPNEVVRQTYADVTKLKSSCSILDREKQTKPIIKMENNSYKPYRQRKKQCNLENNLYKGKSGSVRQENKSSQDTDSFSSVGWSHSRRKHHKKGMKKLNRREKREAARDGIDFAYQELGRSSTEFETEGCKRFSIDITHKIFESLKLKAMKQPRTTNNSRSHSGQDYSKNCITFVNSGDSVNTNERTYHGENECNVQKLLDSKTKSESENMLKSRVNSESSVESEDSFIVFDYDDDALSSDSDESINSCFETDVDSDNVESSDKASNSVFKQCNYPQKCSNSIKRSDIMNGCRCEKLRRNLSCNKKKNREITYFNSVPYVIKNKQFQKNGKDCSFLDALPKYRRNSECSVESEDSFIVFDSASEDSVSCSSDSDEEDVHILGRPFEINVENDHGEDESDDQVDFGAISSSFGRRSYLNEINDRWKTLYPPTDPTRLKNKVKEVHFPPDGCLAKVKTMVTWNFALRAARVGPWEELARDTMRFQNRIKCIGEILQPILDASHRKNIWKERFNDGDY